MPTLRNKDTGDDIGTISQDDLQFLKDLLEEESEDDTDYYIDADTIDMLEEDGGSEALITLLREALGEEDGIEVDWA